MSIKCYLDSIFCSKKIQGFNVFFLMNSGCIAVHLRGPKNLLTAMKVPYRQIIFRFCLGQLSMFNVDQSCALSYYQRIKILFYLSLQTWHRSFNLLQKGMSPLLWMFDDQYSKLSACRWYRLIKSSQLSQTNRDKQSQLPQVLIKVSVA